MASDAVESDAVMRAAARRALEVLETIRDADADQGVVDPDVTRAIAGLRSALRQKPPAVAPARSSGRASSRQPRGLAEPPRTGNRWGFEPNEPLRVVDGRLKGRSGRYAGASNARGIYLEVDGRRTTVSAAYVERVAR